MAWCSVCSAFYSHYYVPVSHSLWKKKWKTADYFEVITILLDSPFPTYKFIVMVVASGVWVFYIALHTLEGSCPVHPERKQCMVDHTHYHRDAVWSAQCGYEASSSDHLSYPNDRSLYWHHVCMLVQVSLNVNFHTCANLNGKSCTCENIDVQVFFLKIVKKRNPTVLDGPRRRTSSIHGTIHAPKGCSRGTSGRM